MQKDLGIGDDMLMVYNRNKTTGMGYTLDGTELNCIQDNNVVGMSVLCMILFSLCVQAAEGLHYGIVPYVSRPALGIVSGMVGAGGNAGAVLTLWTIFKQVDRTDTGFVILGIVVMAEALLMLGIYFPQEGGLLFKAGALSYDPQRWKPPADLRGADQMDYASATITKSTKENTV